MSLSKKVVQLFGVFATERPDLAEDLQTLDEPRTVSVVYVQVCLTLSKFDAHPPVLMLYRRRLQSMVSDDFRANVDCAYILGSKENATALFVDLLKQESSHVVEESELFVPSCATSLDESEGIGDRATRELGVMKDRCRSCPARQAFS